MATKKNSAVAVEEDNMVVTAGEAKASASDTKASRPKKDKKSSVKAEKTVKAVSKAADPEFYIQYMGKDVSAGDVADQIRKIWTDEMEKKPADLKQLQIYFKPEDNRAYYVINKEISGSVEI